MRWITLEEASKHKLFLAFVHSESLPLSRRIKEILEEKADTDIVLVHWHKDRDIALRLTEYPPRLLIVSTEWELEPLDEDLPDKLDQLSHRIKAFNPMAKVTDAILPSYKYITEAVLREFVKNLLFLYDPYLGGFGHCPKFLETNALLSSLSLWLLERDIRTRMIVEDTLNVILHSPLYQSGLISSFSYDPAWKEPSMEYTLETQCSMVNLLLMGAKSIPKPNLVEEAKRIFKASQSLSTLNASEKYQYARTMLLMHQATHESKLIEEAKEILEEKYDEPYIGTKLARIEALLELYFSTGEQDLVNVIIDEVEDLISAYYRNGVFIDTTRNIPVRYGIEENSKVCELLFKIAYIAEKEEYREIASTSLEKMAKKALDSGVRGLSFIVPLILLIYGPMQVNIKGNDNELKRATFTLINPLRIIKYQESAAPSASLCFSDICFPETRDANQLRDHIVSLLISGR
ncbi:hypothetical protein TST_0134 [Thermosulfidibacter takaii ABI70S6]|uniref:Uncharacterized protein n=1 Tax=Thermosulfidibacter takaii (strain DSM 17441 / JCM 13301 / NBRC 103674 / ABI70S6) TaxID=1298851 RepID=A0A0S3QRH7_THET7|nr:hypothetical protein [Thermosulfidibacter takaii]BAT70944.1 hypothetical protein TST_0134 [Thermosulfidibacter takaii ABI70S6]